MHYQVTIPTWLSLAPTTRQALKELFNVERTGSPSFQQVGTVGTVTSDGHTHPDLAVITLEKMNEYLGESNMDFFPTFEKVVQKIEGYPVEASGEVVPELTQPPGAVMVFCEFCTSKGVRHKKDCPKAKK